MAQRVHSLKERANPTCRKNMLRKQILAERLAFEALARGASDEFVLLAVLPLASKIRRRVVDTSEAPLFLCSVAKLCD